MRRPLMLEAALGYAELGIAILPMRTDEKIPLTRHGSRDASRDPGQISRWWRRWPTADLSLASGMISGFDALDVDRQHGGIEALAGLIDHHGPLPETSRQQTPSGGFHLLFRHRPGLKNRSGGHARSTAKTHPGALCPDARSSLLRDHPPAARSRRGRTG